MGDLLLLLLLLGVNLDLRRADIELVVEELRIDEVSEGFFSEAESWWEDIVDGLVSVEKFEDVVMFLTKVQKI